MMSDDLYNTEYRTNLLDYSQTPSDYKKPVLYHFGDVRDITLASSIAADFESGPTSPPKKPYTVP